MGGEGWRCGGVVWRDGDEWARNGEVKWCEGWTGEAWRSVAWWGGELWAVRCEVGMNDLVGRE